MKVLTRAVFLPQGRMLFNQSCFWLQIRNSQNKDEGEKKRKTKSKMKNELIRSLQECKIVENVELNERTQSVTNHEQAIPIIKDYELVIRSKEKGILNVAYRQELLFREFDSNKFEQML